MDLGCMVGSHIKHLSTPNNLTENHYEKKFVGFGMSQKSASIRVVVSGIAVELQPRRLVFKNKLLIYEIKGVC